MKNFINEAFDNKFDQLLESTAVDDAPVNQEALDALNDAIQNLMDQRIINLKNYEIAMQDALEDIFPDKLWWEITSVNIFQELFETRDPWATARKVAENIKDDADSVQESIHGDANKSLDNVVNTLGSVVNTATQNADKLGAGFKDVASGIVDIKTGGLGKTLGNMMNGNKPAEVTEAFDVDFDDDTQEYFVGDHTSCYMYRGWDKAVAAAKDLLKYTGHVEIELPEDQMEEGLLDNVPILGKVANTIGSAVSGILGTNESVSKQSSKKCRK